LHAMSNLSSARAGAYTTLWSSDALAAAWVIRDLPFRESSRHFFAVRSC
jgi:hypothetical protein